MFSFVYLFLTWKVVPSSTLCYLHCWYGSRFYSDFCQGLTQLLQLSELVLLVGCWTLSSSCVPDHCRFWFGFDSPLDIVGNTHVTCHVGVPSCGQRHRNMFITYLLTYAISNTILKSSPRLASMRRAHLGPFFPFPHPPTPVLSPYILYLPNPSPVEEDQWKGGFIHPVHRPSPRGAVDVKSPASTHPIDYQVNPLVFYLWWREHPQDQDAHPSRENLPGASGSAFPEVLLLELKNEGRGGTPKTPKKDADT